jgi:putative tryptophan/tyrosine transport system substrate-binding protein
MRTLARKPLARVFLAVGISLVAGLARAAPTGKGARIRVLMSQDAAPYQEALAGFRQALARQDAGAEIEVVALHGEAAQASEALAHARQGQVTMLFTLGSLATQAAVRQVHDVPIVAGLILNTDDLGHAANATGVVLEFPVETEFRWLQRLLPGQRKIGVLFNAAENQGRIDAAGRAAKSLGLTLQARSLESPRDLPDALDNLTNRADVLWGVADQVVLTPQTARPILLFSLRNRIPFVGLSLTWVKAGALYALDRDYGDIGAQCGEMALKILQGSSPASLPPVAPRKVVYSVNLKTARQLKVDIPENLLRGAQQVIE